MSWARFDDGILDHPKFTMVTDLAAHLWWKCVVWSRKQRTNGVVPRHVIATLVRARGPEKLAKELVEAIPPGFAVGLFEVIDGGWLIHDFEDYGPPTDGDLSKKRAEAGRKGGLQRKQREANAKQVASEDQANEQANAKQVASGTEASASEEQKQVATSRADAPAHVRVAAPARPDPVPSRPEEEKSPAHEVQPETPPPSAAEKPKTVRDEIAELLTGSPEIVEAIEGGTLDLDKMVGGLLGDAMTGGWKDRRVVECLPSALRALSMAGDPAKGPRAYVQNMVARIARPGVLEREMAKFTRQPRDREDRDESRPPRPEWFE